MLKFLVSILLVFTAVPTQANNVLPTQTHKQIGKAFTKVHKFLTHHVPQFDEESVNVILADLRLKQQTEDGYIVHPNLLASLDTNLVTREELENYLSFEHMIQPYRPLGQTGQRSLQRSLHAFISKILKLNSANASLVSALIRVIQIHPPKQWFSRMQANLAPVSLVKKRTCHKHNDLTRALKQGIHSCLVYDSLTRNLFKNPSTLLKVIDDYYSSMFEDLHVRDAGMFWLIKFPSVRTPIKAFIKSSIEARLEEDELGEFLSRTTLRAVGKFIEKDPVLALRTNIEEASYAEIVIFSSFFTKYGIRSFPPNTYAGLVLKTDNMFGSPTGCDPNCQEVFGRGKFTFTDSGAWMHLYSSWNLAFTMAAGEIFEWWAKLLAPAVLEDTTGEEYIIRRAIALYLALNRSGFKLDTVNRLVDAKKAAKEPFNDPEDCRNEYSFTNQLDLQFLFGEENKAMAERYEALLDPNGICKQNLKKAVKSASRVATVVSGAASGIDWLNAKVKWMKDWVSSKEKPAFA